MSVRLCLYEYLTSSHVHSMVFWLGDLNYRLTTSAKMTAEMIRDYADKFQFQSLRELDQVRAAAPPNDVM